MASNLQQNLDFASAAASADTRGRNLWRALRAIGADQTLHTFARIVFDQTSQGAPGRTWTATRAQILDTIWGPVCSANKITRAVREGSDSSLLTITWNMDAAGGHGASTYAINWAGVAAILGDQSTLSPDRLEVSPDRLEVSPDRLEVSPDRLEVSPDRLEVSEETRNISAQAPAPVACSDLLCYDDVVKSAELALGNPDWPIAIGTARKILDRLHPKIFAIIPDQTIEVALSAAALSQAMGEDGDEWIARALEPCCADHVTKQGAYFNRLLVAGLIDTLGHHSRENLTDPDKAKSLARAQFNEALRRLRPDVRKHMRVLRRKPADKTASPSADARDRDAKLAEAREEAARSVPSLRGAFMDAMRPGAP